MREITFLLRNEAQSLLNVKLTLIYFDKYIRESPLIVTQEHDTKRSGSDCSYLYSTANRRYNVFRSDKIPIECGSPMT